MSDPNRIYKPSLMTKCLSRAGWKNISFNTKADDDDNDEMLNLFSVQFKST